MAGKSDHAKRRGFWRTLRIYFRRFRIVTWLILLALLGSLIYLNQSGLPGFIKNPFLERLRAQGIDLQFARLRLRFYEGLVAEDARFGRAVGQFSPRLSARQARVSLDWKGLLHGRARVDSLIIRGGTFRLPVADGQSPGRELVVSNIQTQLRLLPDDQWVLDQFNATFADARLRLSARVDHASAARDWALFKGGKGPKNEGRLRERLKSFLDTLEKIRFQERPELTMRIEGDAADVRSFSARLDVLAPAAETPWGSFTQAEFNAHLYPSKETSDFIAAIRLNAQNGVTQWGSVQDFRLGIDLTQPETITNIVDGKLRLSAGGAQTKWGSGADVSANVRWLHSVTNPIPLQASGEVSCINAETKWAKAGKASITGSLTSTNGLPQLAPPEWAWWTNLNPFSIQFEGKAEDVISPRLEVHSADLAGSWTAPNFEVSSVNARLYDGTLSGNGRLNVDTRRAAANASLDFDVHKVGRVMTEGGRRWIEQYSWKTPPVVSASGAVILPSWTNRQPDWRAEVLPSLWLDGRFVATNGAGYKGLEALGASSRFIYSNMTWHLPNLVVERPEGLLEAEHVASDRTRDYYWKIHSTVDPAIIRTLLKTNETRIFELLKLSSPPEINAEVWGHFHRYDLFGARARVVATNLSFRGQSATRIEATVLYSNKVVLVLEPKVERGEERAAADAVLVDFNAQQVYLTNAHGTADPLAIARAIGPKVGRTMEAYKFDRPPRTRAYGTIPMHGELGSDLHFDVDGGPFHWWKFNIPRIAGHVHWKDYQLSLSDIDADFYNGKAAGNAVFDLSEIPGTEFVFSMTGTNVLLQALVADLSTTTNKSEGWLDGTVVVTSANSDDWRTVQGRGALKFHDGLLWDIPLFGVLSPVLDGIVPGLGSSRATEGDCTYIITNGVFRTSNLDIRTTTMRLQYKGDVDLAQDYQLNAHVEAEMLKDIWVVGPLISTVLWPVTKVFEYKVQGTLDEPKLEPVNVIPKLMLIPFYPFRIFKGIGSDPQKTPGSGPAPQ